MTLKGFLKGFGLAAIILTLIPLIAMNFWWIRMFDFPHLQLTFLTLIALLVYFLRFDLKSTGDYFFALTLATCFLFQLMKIWPYTKVAPFELFDAEEKHSDRKLKIFTSNVYQDNREWQKVVNEAKKYDPDLMLFTETHDWWVKNLKESLSKTYEYGTEVPLNNTYGMYLLSRYRLSDLEVRYLVDDSIPSIHGLLHLPSGDCIKIHAIHPTPPMPQENPKSTERDAELMKVALMSRDSDFPVVALGDFNDVAWSQSTSLFQDVSGLLDMRKGRGFYNTYNAKSILMRWPLDHLFVSSDFRFGGMNRGEDVGSDHFPFIATVYLEPEGSKEQEKKPPTQDQLTKARKEIQKARKEAKEDKAAKKNLKKPFKRWQSIHLAALANF